MTTFISLDDVSATREQLGTPGQEIWRTFFLKPAPGTRGAQAFIVQYAPGRVLRTHFHDADEFQIVIAGEGTFGRHAVHPYAVHFARAFTPYGPIVAGTGGLSFLTLRARRDSSGPQLLPKKRAELDAVADRRPWQASQFADFSAVADGIASSPLPGLDAVHGVGAFAISLAPHARFELPALPEADGRYVALVEGSLSEDEQRVTATAIAFDATGAGARQLAAGPDGARLLSLTFPAFEPRPDHADIDSPRARALTTAAALNA